MGLFGFGKKAEKNTWKMEVGGVTILNGPAMGDIEAQLTGLLRGNSEFLILTPPEPVKKCNFMQVTNDKAPELFHVEFSILKDGSGYILYGKDGLPFEKAYDLFIDYMVHGQVPDPEGWDIVMEF